MENRNITLGGESLTYVKTRLLTPVSIYKNDHAVARIGPTETIQKELTLHKQLLVNKFPVAKLLSEGTHGNEYYYMEESLGEFILGKVFSRDTKNNGAILGESFESFLRVTERYAAAQVQSARTLAPPAVSFREGIQLGVLLQELLHIRELAEKVVARLESRLSVFPTVFTQGDFNPHNLFVNGVIDFDAAFAAPLGYDLVTAVFHTYAFSKENLDNYYRAYQLSQTQEDRYLSMVDGVVTAGGYPSPIEYLDEFILARFIWASVHMGDLPNVQKWRYSKLERMMQAYMNNESVLSIHKM